MTNFIRKCVQELKAYTPGEQPTDASVVKLNTNENPYPPSPAVRRALARIDPEQLRRYPDPQCRLLRETVARLHRCSPEQVFVGNGSDEILALCSRAFVEDNDRIGFFEPSYSLYPVLARIRNVGASAVKLGRDFGWRMPARLNDALFYLTNPNSPTGILYPRAEVERFCRRFRGVVVLDEAYVDFAERNCADLALKSVNVIVARTFSKAYSLAGLRAGYAIGHKRLIGALAKIKDSYNMDRVTQELAIAALKDQAWMRANARKIVSERRRLSAALAGMGFKVLPSQTNFIFVRPPVIAALEMCGALRRENILVRHFGAPATNPYLRITVGTGEQTRRLIEAVAKISAGAER